MRTTVLFSNYCDSIYICTDFILRKINVSEMFKPYIYNYQLGNVNCRHNYVC